MCMTKREKALSRFYSEIKEALKNNPKKGIEAIEKTMKMAEEAKTVEVKVKDGENGEKNVKYKKSVPTYSVDTIKTKIREEFFPKPKKQSKGEEILEFFKKKMAEEGQTVEA